MESEAGDRDMIQNSVRRLLDFAKNADNHPNRFSASIFMVPSILRDLSPGCFNPRVVAIGPLHKEDENVQAFEPRKATYLNKLMSYIDSPQEVTMESCVHKVHSSMDRIKACYVWTRTYDMAEIVEMMVIDACFILEFLYELMVNRRDTFFVRSITRDLILLENQIPFFILSEIFHCTILKFKPHITLVKLIYPLLSYRRLFEAKIKVNTISIDDTHHILSLIHECYKPQDSVPSYSSSTRSSHCPSATDLDRAGVNFTPNTNSTWMMEMEVLPYFSMFWKKPTLKMPQFRVHDSTELVLRNLIAYEQQSSETHKHITSYAVTMDMLVNTQEDVAKLVESGVLLNVMGSNEEAANMINNMCKHVVPVDSFYEEQWTTLNKYCNSYWPKHIAWMKSTYFSNPWNMIALVAGILLFILTTLQTIFTIKSA